MYRGKVQKEGNFIRCVSLLFILLVYPQLPRYFMAYASHPRSIWATTVIGDPATLYCRAIFTFRFDTGRGEGGVKSLPNSKVSISLK